MNELTRAVEWAVGNPEAAVLLWILSICVVSGGVLLIFHFVERAVDVEMVKARDAAGEIAALKAERDAAVADLAERSDCEYCASLGLCRDYGMEEGRDITDEVCRACGKCPCGSCEMGSRWSYRGAKKEEATP